jgi:type I restriction enzyme S subunit
MSEDLPTVGLDELVELRPEKVASNKDPNLPYIGLEHIAQGHPRLLGSLPSNASVSINCYFSKDDILFGKLRPNLRKSLRAPFAGYCSTDIIVLRARDGVLPRYAAHVFQWEQVFAAASATAVGTKMPRTSWNELRRYRVFKPGSEIEQFRIAAVLDTVDEAIAKTEAVIAKLRQVRAGLLHDLLTRGLDHNGQLRDPIAHPEQFQDSPLGRIPSAWKVNELSALCSHIGSGVTPRGGQDVYTSSGIMLIRSQNVTFEGLLLDDVAFIPEEINLGMLRSEVFAHDVLFNITGASIGRCCPMPEGLGTTNVNQHVCALRVPKATAADAKYLASLLASPIGQRQMDSLLTVGNRQGLNYQQLGSFVIPWPEEDERKAISSQIHGIEDQIRAEEKEHGKLALLKSGLMTDLLTGRVRVPNSKLKE